MSSSRIGIFFSAIAVAVLLLAAGPGASSAQGQQQEFTGPVTLAVDLWPPYVTKTENYKPGGFATEIVQEAFTAAGVSTQIYFSSWTRCIEGVRHGEFAATYPWYDLPERRKFALFSAPICTMRYVIFYRKDSINAPYFKEISDLRGYRIATLRGTVGESLLREAGVNGLYPINADICFRMLAAGRVDMVVEEEAAGWEILNNAFPNVVENIATAKKAFKDDPAHLIVSKKHPQAKSIVKRFNRGLKTIRQNGKYGRILERYGVQKQGI